MQIKHASLSELEAIMQIYDNARRFMRDSGNPLQWGKVYPPKELLLSDIENKCLYTVCENNEILAVFFFAIGDDPTYAKIYDGEWKNDLPYGVIHRIAVGENAHGKGVSALCFNFAFEKSNNVKIDTHKDNIPMQKALVKNGFEYCGVIKLENGDERIAFQKTK